MTLSLWKVQSDEFYIFFCGFIAYSRQDIGYRLWAKLTAYLRVRYLRGFFSQTAALCWNQVIILSTDILIRVVQTSRTGSRRRPEQMERKHRGANEREFQKSKKGKLNKLPGSLAFWTANASKKYFRNLFYSSSWQQTDNQRKSAEKLEKLKKLYTHNIF